MSDTAAAAVGSLSSAPVTKSTADTNPADVSPADESSKTTDLFSVHDFDVNINMDITPGTTLVSIKFCI